jgi:uncharacterized protein (DUF927 family)
MGVILRISGKELDVDNFDLGWNITPSTVHRKGEPVRISKPDGKKKEFFELVFEVSNADYSDLKSQIKETTEFLDQNKDYLNRLSAYSTIETIALDFSFNSRIDRKNVEVQFDYFPAELIKLAGQFSMDIWLTQWPCEAPDSPKQLRWRKVRKRK